MKYEETMALFLLADD